jgi:predicted house-cleaning NTP pyrophosphatase (Maf/HAM1 superfamily)
VGVTSINGSYYNVMGLPVQRLNQELQAFLNDEISSYVDNFIY